MINAKKLSENDKQMAMVGIKAAATALFAAHTIGLIRFPYEEGQILTEQDIESKLTFVLNCAIAKIEELDPNA